MKTCRKCSVELNETNCPPSFLRLGITICRVCHELENKLRTIKNRKLLIAKLGGKCECCGKDNYDYLSIDHINGGGQQDRKSFKRWKNYIKHLLNMDIDILKNNYRCLCYNCNYSKGSYKVCCHGFNKLSEDFISLHLNLLPITNRCVKNPHLIDLEKRKRNNVVRQIRRIKYKLEMIYAYGEKCTNCSENNPLFLVLDHINNNGNFEIKGTSFYQRLKLLGYPGNGTQLQLLCHNCNAGKEYIQNRVNGSEDIKVSKEIYQKKQYSISEQQENELWERARLICAKLKASIYFAGINA